MEQPQKIYDLGERTAFFAEKIRDYWLRLPKNMANQESNPQLFRAGSFPGANYIEANESIGDKGFTMKIKICRREAKEFSSWMRLTLLGDNQELKTEHQRLRQEAKEFALIFTAIGIKRS